MEQTKQIRGITSLIYRFFCEAIRLKQKNMKKEKKQQFLLTLFLFWLNVARLRESCFLFFHLFIPPFSSQWAVNFFLCRATENNMFPISFSLGTENSNSKKVGEKKRKGCSKQVDCFNKLWFSEQSNHR